MMDEVLLKPDVEYQAHLSSGRFMLQRSRSSGEYVFYPRVAAPGTGKQDLEWVASEGLGSVYAVTVIYPRPPAEPYNVAIIELDDGPRLMSRVDGLAAEDVQIGQRVKVRITEIDGKHCVVFDPQ